MNGQKSVDKPAKNIKIPLISKSKLAHFIFIKYDKGHILIYFHKRISNFDKIISSCREAG